MPFPIEEKLVIGVASSALFDLSESHQVYLDQGPDEYRAYQERQRDVVLGRGVAFSFIRRFLSINRCFPQQAPVEVVLFSQFTRDGLARDALDRPLRAGHLARGVHDRQIAVPPDLCKAIHS